MTDEEDVTAQVLQLTGAPPDPPAERTERVRQAVHREWRASRRRRMIRRGAAAATALLAVAASLVITIRMNPPRFVAPPPSERGLAIVVDAGARDEAERRIEPIADSICMCQGRDRIGRYRSPR